jgi:FtsP/CotA-like multicopper oxidase with cupredoxin domain
VANASNQVFLALQVLFGTTPQPLELIALDGIPVTNSSQVMTIELPPAGRAEFIVRGPPLNTPASFWQIGVDTGSIGNTNPPQQLAIIQTSANAQEPPSLPPAPATTESSPQRFAGLAGLTPTTHRKLYFIEATNGSAGPTGFFIALDGQTPKVFNPNEPPSIVTKVGAVEDWTIENRTGEDHAFHIRQLPRHSNWTESGCSTMSGVIAFPHSYLGGLFSSTR